MSAAIPRMSKAAALVVGFLTISPFAVALDLAAQVFPDLPAIQTMRSASFLAKAMWLALGPLGIAAVLLLLHRPLAGFVLTLPYAAGSVIAGYMLWQQWRPFGIVLLVLACVLAGIGARQAQSTNSFKPNPRREAA